MTDKDTLYARWLSGDITPEEITSLKQSGEWAELESIIKATDDLSLPEYNQDKAFEKLLKNQPKTKLKTESKIEDQTKIKRFNFTRLAAIAASLAVLVSAYFLLPFDSISSGGNISISAATQETKNHTTPDKSEILINDGSEITYNTEQWDTERRITLKGEAKFDVTKGVPFIVETPLGNITVLGTSFNIRSWSDQLIVECYSGSVSVSNGNTSRTLVKGEGVRFNEYNQVIGFKINHTEPIWQGGKSKFRNENLKSVFDEMARQFGVKINCPDFDQTFNGAFTHKNLKTALGQVCRPMGHIYEINADGSVNIIK